VISEAIPRPPTLSRRAVLATVLALVCPGSAPMPRFAIRALTIDRAWTRPAAVGANGAGYLTITNRGNAADALISVATADASSASIHESRMVGQVMTMRPITALPIAAGASVSLRPGGLHLMFERLSRSLKVGESLPAVLTFARAGRVEVRFQVWAGPAMPAM